MHRTVSFLGKLSVCVLLCVEILYKGTTQAQTQPGSIEQWVSGVINFSSEWRSWPATAVQGKPDVYPRNGDIVGAWAQIVYDDNQFIEIEFLQKLFIENIDIYETYHAGGVMRILAKHPDGSWHTVWQTQNVSDLHSSRIFSPHFDKLTFECNVLRLEIDCTKSGSYVEIDAIKIIGTTFLSDSHQQGVLKHTPVTNSSNLEGVLKHTPVTNSSNLEGVLNNTSVTNSYNVEQWVSKVRNYSSEYDTQSWPASCVEGQSTVYPNYGDIPGAWAQAVFDANQFIEIEFLQKLFIENIDIYETYHAGGVMRILAKHPDGSWHTVWQTQNVSDLHSSRIFSPHFDKLTFECNVLRLEIDCTKSGSYVEIDAIKIIGTTFLSDSHQQGVLKHTPVTNSSNLEGVLNNTSVTNSYNVEQWVSKVRNYSSEYDTQSWPASCVEGQSTVYPNYGDIPGAWAQAVFDANQFIEIEFLQKLFIENIDIYETYHAGGVMRILAKHPDGSWHTVWQTQNVSDLHSSRIFSPHFDKLIFECNVLRLEIDCTKSGSYVEIDAIKIIGTTFLSDSHQQGVLKHTPVTNSSNLEGVLNNTSVTNSYNVEQWVSKVRNYSSEYDTQSWPASCVEGQSTVYPNYGDIPGAWAQAVFDANQFIEIEFLQKLFIENIDIYETYHAGGVMRILAKHPDGSWHNVWQTQNVSDLHSSRIFSPHFDKLTFECNVLRLEIDCTKSGSYVEIDAIKIIGTTFLSDSHQQGVLKHTPVTNSSNLEGVLNNTSVTNSYNVERWVSKVRNYSSEYDTQSWPASCVEGQSTVYPNYGDIPGAWAQAVFDANQFIEIEFLQKLFIENIDIYETYHAGGVMRILAKHPDGSWHTVWQTQNVSDLHSSRIFSPHFDKLTFECNVLRLEIDCTKSGSYVEIDAIQIIGTTFLSDSHQQGVLKHTPVTNSSNLEGVLKHTPVTNSSNLEGVLNNTSVTNSYNVEQWVSKVRNYSSEYDTQSWPASCVEGQSTVYPNYGDIPGAWAQAVFDANQFIEIEFLQKLFIENIDIYETYHAGGVMRILAKHPDGSWHTVWQTQNVSDLHSSRIFSPHFDKLTFECNVLRLEIDCTKSGSYVEIDAIKIIGTTFLSDSHQQGVLKHTPVTNSSNLEGVLNNTSVTNSYNVEQWVSKVRNYSSEYDTQSWPASCVEGQSTVYPNYGDIPGAWAQAVFDANQFIEIEFLQKLFIENIDIYETYHAGGVMRILAKHPDGSWHTVWQTQNVSDLHSSRIFSPHFDKLTFECNVLRLEIDCTKSGSYVEIDAIKIIGTTFLSDSHQQGVLKHTPVTNSSNLEGVLKHTPVTNSSNLEGVLNNTSVTNSYNVEQWVSKVRNYSSEYDTQSWPASCVEGQSTVYPNYGDIPGAWAQAVFDANQFIEIEFLQKLFIENIDIYETYHAGGVMRILAKHPDGSWHTVWQTQNVSDLHSSRIFSPHFDKLTFECNVLRLEIDCTKSGSYVEIDAIKIIGTTFLSDSHQQGVLKHTPVTNSSNLEGVLKHTPVTNSSNLEGVLNNTSVTNSYNVEQWVSKVRNYSSEYDTQSWPASCVEGQSTVYPNYGDIPGAWAQAVFDANQFIEIEFLQKLFIENIDIYETYHAGGVMRILAKHPDGSWHTVWQTQNVSDLHSSRIFSPHFDKLTFECNVLRLEIDCTKSGSYVEIDAIKIIGTTFLSDSHQQGVLKHTPVTNSSNLEGVLNNTSVTNSYNVEKWVSKVRNYSSEYDTQSWPASCVEGQSTVYPNYGDIPGAWAQAVFDANQFIEIEFLQKLFIENIDIYETYHAGGVMRILAKHPDGSWHTVWQTQNVSDLHSSRIFSPHFDKLTFECNVLRLEIDCTKSGSYVEIDAIKIIGTTVQGVSHQQGVLKHTPVTNSSNLEEWVSKVRNYSSQWDGQSWPASCVEGQSTVYPNYGDIPGAWAQAVLDANQFIEIEFLQKLFIENIDIYETYHAGGVMRILAKHPDGSWHTVWQTQNVSDLHSSRIFSPHFDKLTFECNVLRLEIDCTKSGSYVEIDAIKIIGTTFLSDSHQQGVLKHTPVTNSSNLEGVLNNTSVTNSYNVEKWVSKVRNYSSEYDTQSWPASCVEGQSTVYPNYGDIPGAWAQAVFDANQFIEIEFLQKLFIENIDIYETYHAGGVMRILAKHPDGSWHTVWQTQNVSDLHSSRIFSPHFDKLTFECNVLRLEIDCTKSGSYVEIDAIKIIGTTVQGVSHQQGVLKHTPVTNSSNLEEWVSKVRNYSSQWDGQSWPASCVEGQSTVYPNYGDIPGAWAQAVLDANQFIEVEYAVKIFIERIDIYETFHAGGVMGILAKHPDGSWHTVWQTQNVSDLHSSRIFSPHFDKLTFECNVLRLEMDCTKSGSYVEIDAIKIIGTTVQGVSHQQGVLKHTPVTNSSNLEEWVSKVRNYSSQWDGQSWPASSLEGQPTVYPNYGDIPGAWAPNVLDANQFIEVEYAVKIFIERIDIYETFHAGGVMGIEAKQPNGSWYTVWQTQTVSDINSSRIFSPHFDKLTFKCNVLKIEVDCTKSRSLVEIDAIKIIGTTLLSDSHQQGVLNNASVANSYNVEQWVSKVRNYSSEYDTQSWSASSVTGQPAVYQKYGDIAGAWAPNVIDANQFIEVEYEQTIFIEKIDIYEKYHAGAVKRIQAKRPDESWYTVWQTQNVSDIHFSRIFSPHFDKLPFQCNVLRIEVDCTASRSLVEIDAIKISGTKFNLGDMKWHKSHF